MERFENEVAEAESLHAARADARARAEALVAARTGKA